MREKFDRRQNEMLRACADNNEPRKHKGPLQMSEIQYLLRVVDRSVEELRQLLNRKKSHAPHARQTRSALKQSTRIAIRHTC
jgi:hypothetical protein